MFKLSEDSGICEVGEKVSAGFFDNRCITEAIWKILHYLQMEKMNNLSNSPWTPADTMHSLAPVKGSFHNINGNDAGQKPNQAKAGIPFDI